LTQASPLEKYDSSSLYTANTQIHIFILQYTEWPKK